MTRWAMIRRVTGIALAIAWMAGPSIAMAQDVPLKTFFGRFAGSGIANSRDAVDLGLTNRDFDVVIKKVGRGFSVTWTTVVLKGQGGDTHKPAVKRSTTTIVFAATDSPRVFKSEKRNDPTGKLGYAWADLDGPTLTVYLLVVNPKSGNYDLHSYERTLTDDNDMYLQFQRLSKGRPRVIVEGRLKRQ